MDSSRSTKTIRNSTVALLEQLIYSIMSFVCRTVFISSLGRTYLGFNGLFSDILTLLSLAELGFGTAIMYSMYKPMAIGDDKKVGALLGLYRKIYLIVGIAILIIGLGLTPFLDFFISDIPDIPGLEIIYILFLLNTVVSYFFIYNKSILIADQKSFIASLIFTGTTIIQNILQIIVLITTKNYIAYLVIQIICTVLNNVCVTVYVNRHYKTIVKYKNQKIEKEEINIIFKNVRAMFLSKISSAVVSSTDNILISKFVSTITLGLYSNYLLFTTILRTIFTKIFEGITGSVGNLVAVEREDKVFQVFRNIWFINFWIVGFSTSALYVLINPFIEIWVGQDYLLSQEIVLIICLNFYMRFIRNTFITFTDTYGLFIEFKKKCVAEAVINFIVSLFFVWNLKMGIYGVLLGTFVSNFTTNFWFEPYVLFRNKFHQPLRFYFLTFLKYLIVMVLTTGLAYVICSFCCPLSGLFGFFIKCLYCFTIINGTYYLIFRKTREFTYLFLNVKSIMTKLKRR